MPTGLRCPTSCASASRRCTCASSTRGMPSSSWCRCGRRANGATPASRHALESPDGRPILNDAKKPRGEQVVAEEGAQLDFRSDMSYGDYLHLDELLSAQHQI